MKTQKLKYCWLLKHDKDSEYYRDEVVQAKVTMIQDFLTNIAESNFQIKFNQDGQQVGMDAEIKK